MLTCGSFSKTVAPGYRIGWLVAGQFAERAARLKRAFSFSCGLLQQLTLTDLSERQRIFGEVQSLFAENQPILYFAAPRLSVATSARLANVEPSLLEPYVLWNADTLAVRPTEPPSP